MLPKSPAALAIVLTFGVSLLFQPARAVIRDGGIDPANLGKGDWVFSMTDATNNLGGHIASVTNETSLMLFYKSQGIRYFIVKAATSDTLFSGCYGGPQFTSALVNIAHTNGILIFGYNRSYGADLAAEVGISDYIFNCGADGFVWDAEAEWETLLANTWITNGPAQAWQLCSTVRSNWPNKFLAHAPFPIIYVHASFPYKEFGFWCDAVMPQIYHFGSANIRGSASAAINWSDVNWKTWQNSLAGLPVGNSNGVIVNWTDAIKPIIPLRDVYGTVIPGGVICEGTAGPHPDKDVMEFIDYSMADPNTQTPGGYQAVNFFRTDLHSAGQFANIKAATVGSFPGIVNNIVLDDARAAVTGSGWTPVIVFSATTTTPTNYVDAGSATNCFGTNYFSRTQGSGASYMQFTPDIQVAGDYDVYQWHPYVTNASSGTPFIISHATGSTTINANQRTNDGNWSLLGRFNFLAGTVGNIRVTDSFSDAGNVAIADGVKLVLVLANAPAISQPPTNRTVIVGQNATFTVTVTGTATLAYQWRFNNTNIPAATTSSYTRVNAQTNDAGQYRIVITNNFGSITSAPAVLTVIDASMDIILDNTNAEVAYEGSWTAGAASADKYLSDYRFASTVAGGTSTATYRPAISTPGYYDVFIWYPQGSNRATNAPWSVVSDGSTNNVPMDQTFNGGGWRLLAAARPFQSGTSGYVRLSNDTGYSGKVVLADGVRFTFSAPFNSSLNISAQPQGLTVKAGSNVTFTVTAAGVPPPAYQWRFNTAPIAGANASSYTRFNAQTNDTGDYSVVVTNLAGSITSSNAALVVTPLAPLQFKFIERLSGGRIHLVVSGEPGLGVWLDRASNFVDWLPLTNRLNPGGTVEFIDDGATNLGRGFYRTRQ